MTNLKPADQRNPYADYTVDQLYAFLSGYELTRDIGAQYEYSNLGMGLLGHALALRAGKSYEALVTERVLRPLGMQHTSIALDAWMQTHLGTRARQLGATRCQLGHPNGRGRRGAAFDDGGHADLCSSESEGRPGSASQGHGGRAGGSRPHSRPDLRSRSGGTCATSPDTRSCGTTAAPVGIERGWGSTRTGRSPRSC